MKDWFIKIDKDMKDSGKWLTRTSATVLGLELAILVNTIACSATEPQQHNCDIINNGEPPKLGEARKDEVFADFNKDHPEYEGREKYSILITLPVCGVPADSIVIPTTDKEKEFINSFEYNYNGTRLTPLDTAIVWTKVVNTDGSSKWSRLGGVSYLLEDNSVNTVWYYTPEEFTVGDTEIEFTDQVFVFNSRGTSFSFWPRVDQSIVDWAPDLASTDRSEFVPWDGIEPFVFPINSFGGPKGLLAPAGTPAQIDSVEKTDDYILAQELIAESNRYTLVNGKLEMRNDDGTTTMVEEVKDSNLDGVFELSIDGKKETAKVTSINGDIITFTLSDGSTAIWDGEVLKLVPNEMREFVPANNIELSGDLVQKYGLEFSPYADKEAIYKDILRSHFNDYINSNIPENAEIMKQMPEHLKDVTLNSDPELVDEFIQTFFELSGGKAVFTDLGWRRYTIDANLPVMFEVIKVDELPSNYFGVMDANPNDKTHRGAGVSMYSFDNGQIVYSIAIVSDTLEYNTEVNEASPYYLAEWDIDQTISNQFRRYIASIYSHSITNGESQSSNYELYIKSTTPDNAHDFFRDIDWEFITAR